MRILSLGRRPYTEIEAAMRAFTHARDADSEDELWLVEHDPVYPQGVAGRDAHVLDAAGVPVVRTDRGGQVTFHGPGQVAAYPLVDLRRIGRSGIFVKEYVFRIEEAVIEALAHFGVTGHRVRKAPGLYVRMDDPFGHGAPPTPGPGEPLFSGLGKIAALGIKVSQHREYHGVALNVAMDLAPFARIDPCGYPGLATVDLQTLGLATSWDEAAARLAAALQRRLR